MKYTTGKISEILKHPTKRMDAKYWIKKKLKKLQASSRKLQAWQPVPDMIGWSLISFDGFPIDKFVKSLLVPVTEGYKVEPPGLALTMKGNMKKFTIEVSHASGPQLLTIATELKIMSNGWEKYGPRIQINGQKLQAPSLRVPGTGHKHGPRNGKLQATSLTQL